MSGKRWACWAMRRPARSPSSACWLAAQAPGFSRLLLDKGIIGGYLVRPGHRRTRHLDVHAAGAEPPRRGRAASCARTPGKTAGPDGSSASLNAAPLDRSEQMVTLMTAVIDAGALDDAVRHPSLRSGDFFTLMHSFKGDSAASGARLVAAWLRRRLALLTADGAYNQPQEPRGPVPAPPRRRRCRRRADEQPGTPPALV